MARDVHIIAIDGRERGRVVRDDNILARGKSHLGKGEIDTPSESDTTQLKRQRAGVFELDVFRATRSLATVIGRVVHYLGHAQPV